MPTLNHACLHDWTLQVELLHFSLFLSLTKKILHKTKKKKIEKEEKKRNEWMKNIRNVMKINMTGRICISPLISLTIQLYFLFQGTKIAGVSCTTDYAQLYLLSTEIDPSKSNQLLYYCNCYGHHGLAKASIQCVMHYWECPLTT